MTEPPKFPGSDHATLGECPRPDRLSSSLTIGAGQSHSLTARQRGLIANIAIDTLIGIDKRKAIKTANHLNN